MAPSQGTSLFFLLSYKLDHPVMKIIILGIQYIVYYVQKILRVFLWTNVLSLKFDETFWSRYANISIYIFEDFTLKHLII